MEVAIVGAIRWQIGDRIVVVVIVEDVRQRCLQTVSVVDGVSACALWQIVHRNVLGARSLLEKLCSMRRRDDSANTVGDFSARYNSSGSLITVKYPKTGTPFQGNMIPGSRIIALGSRCLISFRCQQGTF